MNHKILQKWSSFLSKILKTDLNNKIGSMLVVEYDVKNYLG
jgi:hypothetical protein